MNQVSRFFNKWNDEHWYVVKRILRYLKYTAHYKIMYRMTSHIEVIGYTDADCLDIRKFISGYVFVLANGSITWKSQQQNVVAQSTTQAEYG